MKRTSLLIAVLLSLMASPAFAHLNPAEHGSFAAGFTHPLSGADHILAMVAVGLWASMLGGRALVVVPLSFVGVMLLGFVAALGGVSLPYVEPVILASVIVLGLLVAMAFRASTLTAALIVGFFAFFHGYAHGGEIGSAAFLSYGAGFALATALLHAAGIGVGLAAGRLLQGRTGQIVMRIAGGFAALSGLYLMAG
ncbi:MULTISPECIES: HupE/UreJ family protein [Brucella/Ochrobactrum group]|jgi:urease accessory protein|uniref:HupE/UreJ protein n=2 Tax=Brucella anthropi TaxID=529 RepID=A6X1P8_BRUA4|nr:MULTISPECIES: HupE/UreJ family protein [Brucella/Ochrobactrum group]ABS15152.1 HupE/UreJ protein [Brucella anthropi ATCC 49188]AIK44686.1 hupE / UreJ family protein [Brucella anthropi]KAB2746985.1 HupE/UreJ family protein [Brucella anthropi]KAB2749958.1 HupE/UreJ family protein [Brucella anthropi]KAB2762181.1 HupE/UreJ family protein [Brucella anthropi]